MIYWSDDITMQCERFAKIAELCILATKAVGHRHERKTFCSDQTDTLGLANA
jgi:hypothetical protein